MEPQQSPSSFSSDSSSPASTHDFVLVSPSNSIEQSCSSESVKVLSVESSVKRFASDGRKEDEMLEKIIEVSRENAKLKETVKNNNTILQKYIKDFTDMQENHRLCKENIKREHQRAKDVVAKLRDDNKTLKAQLKEAQSQISQETKKERVVGLERENTFLKNEITILQEHIHNIDQELKDCELPDGTFEHWQVLLGSLASYNYQTGISQRNFECLAREMSSDSDKSNRNMEDKCAGLEIEKAILKTELEKTQVEKQHAEEMVEEFKCECKKLEDNFQKMEDEKKVFQKLLDEKNELNKKEKQQHKELETVCQNLEAGILVVNGELHHAKEQLVKAEKENEELSKLLESQKKTQSQKETVSTGYDDDDEHTLCKEKYNAIHELYFKAQKQVNTIEERENTLCAKEKAFEVERKQLEETRKQLEAELDAHSKSFLEKTEQLHSELREAREREETLQKEIDQLHQEYQEREENLQGQVCQLIKENEALRVKVDKLTEINNRRDHLYEERMKQMEKGYREKENENSSIIGQLKAELRTNKEDRKKYQEQTRTLKMEHDRIGFQHDQLMKEYDELLSSYNETMEASKVKTSILQSSSNAMIENYKGQMDEITAHLASADEAVTKKDAIISDLKERLQSNETQCNEISILKEQVGVYYNDFKAEREARERQHADILNLQEQNERLTHANEELQIELDNIMNNHQMAEMQRRHIPQQATSSYNANAFTTGFHMKRGRGEDRYDWRAQEPPLGPDPRGSRDVDDEEPFPCPGCRRCFPHFDLLQNHVQHCEDAIRQSRPSGNLMCPMCDNEFPDQDTLEIHVQECLRDA